MTKDNLTITDNRTGKSYEVPLADNAVRAIDLRQIKTSAEDFGLMSYDPAFLNTASAKSRITFIDGEEGILRYRGYPIEELAEKSSYIETAYLLINGELPNKTQLHDWAMEITYHTLVHKNIRKFINSFRYDAHPMGILVSTLAGLSTFYPEAKNIFDTPNRHLQHVRLIGKIITLAAYSYRHSVGLDFVSPRNDMSYPGNFLHMMFKMTDETFKPHPVLERALDVLFILHADHEQNASTNVMRCVGSSHVDPFTAASAATATLYGPLHGGANEAVINNLQEIGSVDRIPQFIESVKKGEKKLMGFGHRIYKNYDPRAKIIKKIAHDVFSVTGLNRLLDVALQLEEIALRDEYFVSRKLYPNIDFYTGLIYQSMKIPTQMFTVMFAIGRMAGWIAQWQEMITDPEQKISRPRQIYLGSGLRHYPENR